MATPDRKTFKQALMGFGIVALPMLAYLRFDVAAIWRDLSIAAGARSGGFSVALLKTEAVRNAVSILYLASGLKKRLLVLTEQVLLGLRAFHNPGRLAGFMILTIVTWLMDSCAAVLSACALGLELSLPIALLLLTGLGLGSALPSTPGYVGIYQFVAVTVLTPFGISRDSALAFIILLQAMGYMLVLALGLPGMYKARAASRTTASEPQ